MGSCKANYRGKGMPGKGDTASKSAPRAKARWQTRGLSGTQCGSRSQAQCQGSAGWGPGCSENQEKDARWGGDARWWQNRRRWGRSPR